MTNQEKKEYLSKYQENQGGGLMHKSCQGCKYRRNIVGCGIKLSACHYLFETGEPRGCQPNKCDKKVIGKPNKKYKMLEI